MHELQVPAKELRPVGCFVTLTYADEHLPANASLDVEEWKRFVKRLRKKMPFRYLHCGEYGELGRPHYHAAIFGQDFREDREPHSRSDSGEILYTSKTLESVWQKGHCPIGELTWESAAYIARYSVKKLYGELGKEHYGERKPPYLTMSRRPGIGAAWYEKFKDDLFTQDFALHNGEKFGVPKFYDGKLEQEDPSFLEGVKQARSERAKEHWRDQTPERLRVRESVFKERMKRLRRK